MACPSKPVVAEVYEEPNQMYLEQLIASAQAAIKVGGDVVLGAIQARSSMGVSRSLFVLT
jgi:hypothetical protein